jgi:hypothetical protein
MQAYRVLNETSTVLLNEEGISGSRYSDDVVAGPRMVMRREHRTWTKIEHSHGEMVTNNRRERGRIRVDHTARAERMGKVGLVIEIEEPVGILREMIETIQLSSIGDKLSNKRRIDGLVNGKGGRCEESQSNGSDGRDLESHCGCSGSKRCIEGCG